MLIKSKEQKFEGTIDLRIRAREPGSVHMDCTLIYYNLFLYEIRTISAVTSCE